MTITARSKAFTDIVKNIRRNALDEAARTASPEEYQRILKEKKALEKLVITI
ncbi:MAG: hypothetical protein IJH73_03215 [Lachnospiraceae bacterium]|nr:hypothetical protein [Lachnospiraceae bacterium]